MKRKIMWVSQHLEIDTMSGSLKNGDDEPASYLDDDEHETEIQNVISTPFGLWRVNDVMNPYKQFKLWMGHTNFSITGGIADTIKNIPGVEVLNILTRYRFVIGVGELFNIRDVRIAIEKFLKCSEDSIETIIDKSLQKEIEELKQELSKEGRYAIYVFPNSKIDYIKESDGIKEFNDKLLLYKNSIDYSHGILIESNDE